MFKIARRVLFYGGIGFILGVSAMYYWGKVSDRLTKPVKVSQLEEIAEKNVVTNPQDHKKYRINFDNLRLEPYQTEQTEVAPPVYQEEKKEDLRKLFE